MSEYFLSVATGFGPFRAPHGVACDFGAIWMEQGKGHVNGAPVGRGEGAFLRKNDTVDISPNDNSRWIRFDLSKKTPNWDETPAPVLSVQIETECSAVLLRLDEVKFPPGAVAYRHVHPGDGIRFLTLGELEVIGDNHRETARAGHAWYEAANSPVRAVASETHPMTRFVRFMVLPVEYAGKPSIQVLDPDDAARPRRQITHRHFDRIVQLDPG